MSFLNNLNAFLASDDSFEVPSSPPPPPPQEKKRKPLVPKDLSSFRYNGNVNANTSPGTSSPVNHSFGVTNTKSGSSRANESHLSSTFTSAINKFSVDVLPFQQRCVFNFSEFNEMQSRCFNNVYGTDKNCVLSSPTGSGKTVVFELAILRANESSDNYKVLYLAPTKALCSERKDDWSKKFAPLGITVGMLTGDTSYKEAESVRSSKIIISTPEKWDMITRKWSDYKKLCSLIKLLLVDEVHVLKEPRGATLEVVMTRMKRICECLRILAISATVANAHDIATWLDAETLVFGEEYRAVKLRKIVYGYKPNNENDFSFDNQLNSKLIEVIAKHSMGKPVLIFCATRNSCQFTAKFLAGNVGGKSVILKLKDRDLANLIKTGVGYHHAGLTYADRKQIEGAFLNGDLKYLCCTSTLAVGINLPAYLVVVKGTKCWCESTFQEYSETDILQMIGRAGRPQFEDEGVAIIMTNNKLKSKYERLIMGTEKVESSLHLNFPENVLAEVAVGNISSIEDALSWLKTTYFYVRFLINPSYYDIPKPTTTEENLLRFCKNKTDELAQETLISDFKCTKFGLSMVMHYIKLDTMKVILSASDELSISELFDIFAKAAEFSDVKIKHQEKKLYKELNKSPLMRYPSESKVSSIIQYELGGLEFPNYNGAQKLQSSFLGDKFFVFKHVSRILKAMMDVFVEKKDAKSLINSGYIMRSISARGWEGSPNELKQLDSVGIQSIKKFVNHNVLTLMDAKMLSQVQIEQFLGLKVGAGAKIKRALSSIPKVKVDAHLNGSEVQINISIDPITKSFKNENLFLQVISSQGSKLVDFRRTSLRSYVDGGFVIRHSGLKVEVEASIMCGVVGKTSVGEFKETVVDIDPNFEFSSSLTSLSDIFAIEQVKRDGPEDRNKETLPDAKCAIKEDNSISTHSLTSSIANPVTNTVKQAVLKKKVKRKKSIFDVHSDDSDDVVSGNNVEKKKPKLSLYDVSGSKDIESCKGAQFGQECSSPQERGMDFKNNGVVKCRNLAMESHMGGTCVGKDVYGVKNIGRMGIHNNDSLKTDSGEKEDIDTKEELHKLDNVCSTITESNVMRDIHSSQCSTVDGNILEEFQGYFGSDVFVE
ncbi:HFM1 [Candida theae]|uniref:DNA 3'-5' helicase n=1 Tax=Candida theae TaxID=1198502 RepID=A0AAD5FYL7_9ASCO|nr:HFM1 [Candida theae]KAI5958246.1 HFM1 [Candida theae]